MFDLPTKMPSLLSFLLVLNGFTGQAQSSINAIPELQPKALTGHVKTVTVSETGLGQQQQSSTKTLSFDRYGRIFREKENGADSKLYLYADQKSVKPILISYVHAKPGNESYALSEFDNQGRLLLSASIEKSKVKDLDVYTFQADKEERKMYINTDEIYNYTKAVALDLSTKNFPPGFAPFEWDRKLSTGFDETSTSYDSSPSSHIFRFKLIEKGKTGSWVEFNYNASDAYDAGKGYWYRYVNNKKTEEKYIGDGSLSDFGHLYQYDAKGRMLKDTYAYFNKIPSGSFIQQDIYTYNQYGHILKSVNTSEGKQGDPRVYTYQYDQKGNWISCIQKFRDGSGTKITRLITYYGENEASLNTSLTIEKYQSLLQQAKQQVILSEKKRLEFLSANAKLSQGPQKKINYRNLKSMNWKDFLPENNTLDSICFGDLNKDGLEDVVLVYQPKKLLQYQQNTVRTLRILFKQPNGQYALAAESPHAVFPEDTNDVFFMGMNIRNGILIIEHEYLRGGCTYKYRFQQGGFYLIGASSNTGDPTYSFSIDYNLSTGQYVIDYQNEDNDPKQKKDALKKGVKKLNPLPNMETFKPFSIQIDDYHL